MADPKGPPPLRPFGAFVATVACILTIVGGGALARLGARSLVNVARLALQGAVTEATVVETRVMVSRRTGRSYQLRYTFRVPGDATVHTASDETGREGLWVAVADEAAWEAARATGHVEVVYLPDDPAVSRPRNAPSAAFGGDQAALLGFGLCLMVGPGLALVGIALGQIERRRRERVAAGLPPR